MSAASKLKMTTAEYLVIERKAATRSEFSNGEMFAMAGARWPHNYARDNLNGELHTRFKGGPCRAISGDMRVRVALDGPYCYPDLVIICTEPEFEDDELDTLLNPLVIVEVLSESTERFDRGLKFRQYQRIDSFREYLLISPDEPLIDQFVRQENGTWALSNVAGLDAILSLTSVPVRIPLSDIYADVTFPAAP